MPMIINYKENSQSNEEIPQKEMSEDMKSWLIENNWKIRKLNAEINGKPLAELIRLDERLIVVIDEEEKKMLAFKNQRFLRPRKQSIRKTSFFDASKIYDF